MTIVVNWWHCEKLLLHSRKTVLPIDRPAETLLYVDFKTLYKNRFIRHIPLYDRLEPWSSDFIITFSSLPLLH